jgi:proline iminopeptidase
MLVLTVAATAPAQQKKELNDAQKTRRLDVVPEPSPKSHPKFYPGTSFRSLRVPDVDYGYVSAGGRNIFYEKVGYGPENIVVVHGGPGLPHNYLVPALQSLAPYATIWFYDARGHGLSEQNYATESYTLQQLVDDIGEFTRAAGLKRYTLFGHSFGGMVALKYAAQKPEGLTRLIVSDTAASLDYVAGFQERIKKAMPPSVYAEYERVQRDETMTADTRLRAALRIVYPYYWYDPPPAGQMDLEIGSMNLNALASDQIWTSDGQSYDMRGELAEISVPTLVLYGRHDIVFTIDDAKALAEGIPNSRLVEMPHSGHYPFFEDNYLFAQWVKTFLQYYST